MKHGTLVKFASLGCLVLALGVESAHAFTIISFDGRAARWYSDKPIQVQYDPNFGGINGSTAISESIKAWKNVPGINIQVAEPTSRNITSTPKYDGVNQVKFYRAGWQSLPFAPPTSALAVTISTYDDDGKILDADMFINGEDFQWGNIKSGDTNDQVHDLQNVVTHEFGHFFGLNHTSENPNEPDQERYEATMYYASLPGEIFRRTLETMDINGIKHLYTTSAVEEPQVDELTPSTMQVDYKGSANFEITGDNFLPTTSVVFARKGYDGDIIGRVNKVDSNHIEVSFDMSNMKSGEYDLVVANSYKTYTRMTKAFTLTNTTVPGIYNGDNASTAGQSGGCKTSGSSSLLIFLLPLIFVLPRRWSKAN